MNTRLATREDLEDLKEIWRLCFGDEESFIALYFQSRDWISETAILEADGRIVSMLTMIPVRMVDETGVSCSASMLYAIATHPNYRKRGYADRLIEFSNQYLVSKQTNISLLVPASEELFRFYEKLGYQNGFFIREAILTRDDVTRTPASTAKGSILPNRPSVHAVTVEPLQYNRIRRNLLGGHSYLDYRDDEIAFQKNLASLFHADLFALKIDEAIGCACAERISEDEVILKELLVPEQYLVSAVLQLSELFPAEKYIVRTPVFSGTVLGGEVRPFGMLRYNQPDVKFAGANYCEPSAESYLGIAYD